MTARNTPSSYESLSARAEFTSTSQTPAGRSLLSITRAGRLSTDPREFVIDAQRPIIRNGIEELAMRGDLLERCLVLTLPTIGGDKRRTEQQFWKAFEDARPRILGALLDAVAAGLRN